MRSENLWNQISDMGMRELESADFWLRSSIAVCIGYTAFSSAIFKRLGVNLTTFRPLSF